MEPFIPSLHCISPRHQRLWTYDPAQIGPKVAAITRLIIEDAGRLLNEAVALSWVSAGLHTCIIKDLVAALAVSPSGGLFMDLDYLFVGRAPTLVHGPAIGSEPVKMLPPHRVPSRMLEVQGVGVQINIGLFAATRRHDLIGQWATAMYRFWASQFLRYLKRSDSMHVSRENTRLWMRNTHCLHGILVGFGRVSAILPVHTTSPWPRWMLRLLEHGASSFGYTIPSLPLPPAGVRIYQCLGVSATLPQRLRRHARRWLPTNWTRVEEAFNSFRAACAPMGLARSGSPLRAPGRSGGHGQGVCGACGGISGFAWSPGRKRPSCSLASLPALVACHGTCSVHAAFSFPPPAFCLTMTRIASLGLWRCPAPEVRPRPWPFSSHLSALCLLVLSSFASLFSFGSLPFRLRFDPLGRR